MVKHAKTEPKSKTQKGPKTDIKNNLDALFKKKASKASKSKEKKPVAEIKKQLKADTTGKSKESKKKQRKYVDNLPVFTEDELKIGKGGDTEDCPFDCNCCF